MTDQEHHTMELVATQPSGYQEWLCPTCGRRFLLQLTPKYQKVILSEGDFYASHSGGTGGVTMGAMNIIQKPVEPEEAVPVFDESSLAPWKDWLEEVDFESLWDR
jgi:hypothetical protein